MLWHVDRSEVEEFSKGHFKQVVNIKPAKGDF